MASEGVPKEDSKVDDPVASNDGLPRSLDNEPANTAARPMLPPTTKMQVSLLETLVDMNIRSEVQDCMNTMLMDVETTFYLRQELELQASRHSLETAMKHHQATILEANAEREFREKSKLELADEMVQEVMTLNKELEELIQWKRDHSQKVQEYDALVAKLAQKEEELEAAQQSVQTFKDSMPVLEVSKRSETKEAVSKEEESKDGDDQDFKPPAKESSLDELATAEISRETATEKSEPDFKVEQEETENETKSTPEEATKESSPPDATAVVALDEEQEEESPTLINVDVELMMELFAFLDPMDILNLAQINLAMYSKIDNIFGISEDGQTPPQPTPAPRPAAPAPAPAAAASKQPPPQSVAAAAPAPSSAAAAQAAGPLGNRLFSMLQPARTAGPGKKAPPGVNASVVQSITSKLSDSEVAAILTMWDRANKMEKEVAVMRQEKEVMAAKLDGTEAVKQFLINKVRDIETKLTKSREDEIKVTQQIASDQEVIAFLDSRVQELERQTETLTKDKSRAQSELETTKVQTSKKITMLSDMLKYEREKLKDEEGEWKATKKVLVKEVKSCRAQILALQAERDGLREQNEMLKRAIVSTGKSPRASSPMRS